MGVVVTTTVALLVAEVKAEVKAEATMVGVRVCQYCCCRYQARHKVSSHPERILIA